MAPIQRTLTDVPEADVAFHKSLFEDEGFVVEVRDQGGGLFTLVGTMGDADPQSEAGVDTTDGDHIAQLIINGSSVSGLAQARRVAKAAWPPFPHNGCAANLSALLIQSDIPVPMTLGAGRLAHILKTRGWGQIDVGKQTAGDVGVTFDENSTPGADHIYLVLEAINDDEMVIVDNQDTVPHHRFASGRGKTPTEFFLRAVS